MTHLKRALGAAAATAVVATGLAVGTAGPGTAAPVRPASVRTHQQLLGTETLVADLAAAITGSGAVGSPLDLTLPSWNLPGVTNSVQWLSDGVAIPGATGTTYVPTLDDAGSMIQAAVTGSLLNLLPVTSISNAVPILAAGGGGGEETGTTLEVLQLPTLAGSPGVGQLLTVTDPVWNLAGVATAYQWFRDGVPIPGATGSSYVPALPDAGHQLSAQVTGTLAGYPVVSALTGALPIPATADPVLSPTGAPSVADGAKVGTATRLTDPTWSQDGVTDRYQWMRDGTAIGGADTRDYTPVAADLGHRISVKVTGHKDGFTDQTVDSNAVPVGFGDAPTYTVQPSVAGTHRVGNTLVARPGAWGEGTLPTFGYQWQRDGVDLAGATADAYTLRPADAGRLVTMRLTVNRTAYRPATFTTSQVRVARLASTTVASLPRQKVPAGKRAKLVVRLRSAGISPTGRVRVLDGGRALKAFTMATAKQTLLLPRLKPGKHRLTVVYAGTSQVAGSRSRAVVLTVLRRK